VTCKGEAKGFSICKIDQAKKKKRKYEEKKIKKKIDKEGYL
jgi:hypothetical protein